MERKTLKTVVMCPRRPRSGKTGHFTSWNDENGNVRKWNNTKRASLLFLNVNYANLWRSSRRRSRVRFSSDGRLLQWQRRFKVELGGRSRDLRLFRVGHVMQNEQSVLSLDLLQCSCCRQNLKFENFTWSFGRLRQTTKTKKTQQRACRTIRNSTNHIIDLLRCRYCRHFLNSILGSGIKNVTNLHMTLTKTKVLLHALYVRFSFVVHFRVVLVLSTT